MFNINVTAPARLDLDVEDLNPKLQADYKTMVVGGDVEVDAEVETLHNLENQLSWSNQDCEGT